MKINSNYNQSFGMKITYNDTYKKLMKHWNETFKVRDVEKALEKIKGCDNDCFELTFTRDFDDLVNPKTLNTDVEFSYTKGLYNQGLKIPTAVKIVRYDPSRSNPYPALNPKEVAKDIVEQFKYYKKSVEQFLL